MASTDLEQAASAIDDAMVTAIAAAESAPPRPPRATRARWSQPCLGHARADPTEARAYPCRRSRKSSPRRSTGPPVEPEHDRHRRPVGRPDERRAVPVAEHERQEAGRPRDRRGLRPDLDGRRRLRGVPRAGHRRVRGARELIASWLGANASGITSTNKTIGGKQVLAIDYGDQGALDYVYEQGDAVVTVHHDPTLVEKLAGLDWAPSARPEQGGHGPSGESGPAAPSPSVRRSP